MSTFQRPQIAHALRAHANLLVFENFTRAHYSKLHSKSCDYLYKELDCSRALVLVYSVAEASLERSVHDASGLVPATSRENKSHSVN